MHRGLFAVAVAAALLLPGCATVPDSGPPQEVANRKLEGADIVVNAPLVEPPANGGPVDTVTLLLEAARTTQSRQLLGEAFFTTTARESWKPKDVLIVRGARTTVLAPTATTAKVKLSYTVVGSVNEFGVYQVWHPWKPTELTLDLVHRDVWRLNTTVPGVLMQESDFEQAFQQVTLYFPAIDNGSRAGGSGEVLVPDPRYVARPNSTQGAATSIVGLLLAGPSPWLTAVARRPLPPKTDLRGNVSTQDSRLVLDFSPEIEGATAPDINLFAAGLAWSMPGSVDLSLRLQVNGRDLNVPGAPAIQDVGDWKRYNPHSGTTSTLFYLHKGGLRKVVDQIDTRQPQPDTIGGALARAGVVTAAVSLNEAALALVKASPGKQTLYLGDMNGKMRAVREGHAISRPTWGGSQDAVLTAIDGKLFQIPVVGDAMQVTVPSPNFPPIRAVRASLDGTRIALIAGDGVNALAYVGLIDRTQDSTPPVLRDLRVIRAPQAKIQDSPLIAKVQDVGWTSPTTVAVSGQEADGTPSVRAISVDGALEPGPVRTGLRSGVVTLAVSALDGVLQTEYVEVAHTLYQGGQRSWSPMTSAPDVQLAFYPG